MLPNIGARRGSNKAKTDKGARIAPTARPPAALCESARPCATRTAATPEDNKALVLAAFDALFNRRDYDSAARFWSDAYIQHSAHIEPGREGLFSLVRSLPDTLRYEHGLILAEGDFVIVHGRFSGHGLPAATIAADILRIEDGRLADRMRPYAPRSAVARAKRKRRP